jgi:putative methyltransferase (TIGR04325 family)
MIIKKIYKKILSLIKRNKVHLSYSGPYSSWKIAEEKSVGIGSKYILQKVEKATKNVLNGKYLYERDGTNFNNFPKKYTLRTKLIEIGIKDKVIVDFGGGLASSFISNRDILDGKVKKYVVVEQQNFCKVGNKISQIHNLPVDFLDTLDKIYYADIIIFSSVLQYIENWKEIIHKTISLKPKFIIVDRQPFTFNKSEIFIQENDGYYKRKVSHPIYFINIDEFKSNFKDYSIEETWLSDFDPDDYMGILFKLKE